jgi:hypothetical protein
MQKSDTKDLFNSLFQTLPAPIEIIIFVVEQLEKHINEENVVKVEEYLTKLKWIPDLRISGFDPLVTAINRKSLLMVKTLVDNGIDPQYSPTAVKLALETKQFMTAIYLIENGGNANDVSRSDIDEDEFERQNTFVEFLE